MHKIPVGVLGASGYAGRELCALISRHPQLSLAFATANSQAGEQLALGPTSHVTFTATEDTALDEARLIFSALPHGASAIWVARARAAGVKVVDLSADLRIGNGASDGVPYGLTELRREQLRGTDLVANPGCYPTSVLVPLIPLIEQGLIAPEATITADCASGVTGAGMTPRLDLLFAEVTENYRAYGAGGSHRHLREMRALVGEMGGDLDLHFTPHLLPVARGILSTITVPLTKSLSDPLAPFRERWSGEPFIEIIDALPELKQVTGRNVVRMTAMMVQGVRRPTLLILSAIDNLLKGAAGQAMQNANLMLGLDETAGLPA